jgi:hypothetical protein
LNNRITIIENNAIAFFRIWKSKIHEYYQNRLAPAIIKTPATAKDK